MDFDEMIKREMFGKKKKTVYFRHWIENGFRFLQSSNYERNCSCGGIGYPVVSGD